MMIDVKVRNIIVDKYPINKATLDLVFYLMSGGEVPAIKLQKLDCGQYKIKDGRHRVTAFKLLGWDIIKAKCSNIIYKRV